MMKNCMNTHIDCNKNEEVREEKRDTGERETKSQCVSLIRQSLLVAPLSVKYHTI